MSVLQNFPFVPQNAEQEKSVRDRRDAQSQMQADGISSRFFPVRLVEMFAPDWRERLGPMKVANVLRHRLGVAGNKVKIEVKIEDGHVYFDYDSQTGYHIAWIYDDDKGYNREFLASHFYNGLMEIMEEGLRKEIEVLAIQKKKEAEHREQSDEDEEPLTEDQIKNMGVDGIDEQIEFLKRQKKQLMAKKADAVTEEPASESPAKPAKRPAKRKRSALVM